MTVTERPPTRLSAEQIRALDPYALMGVLGKRVIHPGGRRATQQLLEWADIAAGEHVLDAGCGVATTAIEVVRRHDATVTALDIAPVMLDRARHNAAKAGLTDRISVDEGDIQDLPYPDAAFDCVLAEAVTMFVDRPRAARELVRVCRPGGRVLATEFYWLRPPTAEARRVFLGEVCPGLSFDSVEDWEHLYADAGLDDVRSTTGAFDMLTVRGFLHDEGLVGSCASSPGPPAAPPRSASSPGSCHAWPAPSPTWATSSSPARSPPEPGVCPEAWRRRCSDRKALCARRLASSLRVRSG